MNNFNIKNKYAEVNIKNDKRKRITLFSVFGSLYLLAFLFIENFMGTEYPWFLYCIPPVLSWPAAVYVALFIPKKITKYALSWVITIVISTYYIMLNFYLSSGFMWSFIVVSAVVWYPFSVMLVKKTFAYSVFGMLWSVVFFGWLNHITSPDVIWAVYPIFGMFWWPLSVFFFRSKK